MHIHVHSHHSSSSHDFREAVFEFGTAVLGRLSTHIATIDVTPSSVRRGWRCHLRVHLNPSGEVLVNETDRDLDVALVRAFSRARRLIARAVRFRSIKKLRYKAGKSARMLRLAKPARVPRLAQSS